MKPSRIVKSNLPYATKASLLRKHAEHDQRHHGNWVRGLGPKGKEKVLAHSDKYEISPKKARRRLKAAEPKTRPGSQAHFKRRVDQLQHLIRQADDPRKVEILEEDLARWRAKLDPVSKHAEHDQSSHGNWARDAHIADLTPEQLLEIKWPMRDDAISQNEVKLKRGTDRYNVSFQDVAIGWVTKSGKDWVAYAAGFGRNESGKLREWDTRRDAVEDVLSSQSKRI